MSRPASLFASWTNGSRPFLGYLCIIPDVGMYPLGCSMIDLIREKALMRKTRCRYATPHQTETQPEIIRPFQ
jgi:hypothetical protein